MTQNSDHVLQYFGCSVYEDWIASRWNLVPDEHKAALGQFLFSYIVENYKVRACTAQPLFWIARHRLLLPSVTNP